MPVLSLDQIESLCFDALKRAGASDEQAAIVAEEIMDAEAEGIRNVGLGYLHLYLKHLRCGKVNPAAAPKIVKTSASTTVVDADFGFCHHAYVIAEERLIETTRAQGVGLMSIHQSSSAGVLGWFVRRLAREGLVSLCSPTVPRQWQPTAARCLSLAPTPSPWAPRAPVMSHW